MQESGSSGARRILGTLILLTVIGVGAHFLTLLYNGGLGYRLRTAATRDYPHRGMYEQSDRLFRYIYEHPEHMRAGTRIDHARLLRERGESERARRLLETALTELVVDRNDAPSLRRAGELYVLLDRQEPARESLDAAIALDESKLESGNDQAATFWSLARSELLAGRNERSRSRYREALAASPPAQLESKIRRWGQKNGWED